MENSKFIITPNATKSEIIDTLGDGLETLAVVETNLSDGFQWVQDLIAIAQQEDEVRDMIASFPFFLEEFQNLPGALAVEAVTEAEKRVIQKVGKVGKVTKFIIGLLKNSASNYEFLQLTIERAKSEVSNWRGMFEQDETEDA